MTFDEFLASLDPKNPFTSDFVHNMRIWNSDSSMMFARKGRDLVEVVQDCCSKRAFPIVDKKMGMVLGVGDGYHRYVRALLFNYHTSSPEHPDTPIAGEDKAATWYIMDGRGYFISAMRPSIVVAGHAYEEDRFDKDLFLMFKVDRTL